MTFASHLLQVKSPPHSRNIRSYIANGAHKAIFKRLKHGSTILHSRLLINMLQIYGTTWTDYLDIKDGVGIFVKAF